MRKKGFTLIELLVVIGIIVVLIGILVPAMGKARQMARQAETESLMTHLSTSIQSYYDAFHAYPGPARVDYTTGAVGGKKVSGSQNLLLGMSYSMATSPIKVPLPFTGSPTMYVDPNTPGTVIDHARYKADGNPEQLSSFFDANSRQISKFNTGTVPPAATWPPAGVVGSAGSNTFNFPVPVDTFNDGLPILYYRRTPGVDKPTGQSTVVSDAAFAAASPFAYYYKENEEYTTSTTLVATSGSVMSQATGNMANPTTGAAELNSRVSNGSGAGISATGGFVLISAGIDRIYGKVGGKPSDDITKVGGN